MAKRSVTKKREAKANGNGQKQQFDSVAVADALLKDMEQKTSSIKKAIGSLQAEKAKLEADYKKQVNEIEKQLGRLQSYLVRLGGGAVIAANTTSSNGHNGKSKRLTPDDVKKLKVKVMELAGHHGKEGLRRSDVTSALDVTGNQATKLLADLEQAKRLKAQGERAGRRYFVSS